MNSDADCFRIKQYGEEILLIFSANSQSLMNALIFFQLFLCENKQKVWSFNLVEFYLMKNLHLNRKNICMDIWKL